MPAVSPWSSPACAISGIEQDAIDQATVADAWHPLPPAPSRAGRGRDRAASFPLPSREGGRGRGHGAAFGRGATSASRLDMTELQTGIGKAGYVAQKFSAVLCSTGTPAVFVHPAEAAHGDLGLIAHGDVIVAFSTSGKTREVLELIELSRHLTDAMVIGITSH